MNTNPDQTYDISKNVDPITHIDNINAIFDFLETMSAEWPEDMIFIDGEFDSNQTDFERLSNEDQIGVTSNNTDVGYCLLLFLRMIIDKNFDYFFSVFETISPDTNEDTDDESAHESDHDGDDVNNTQVIDEEHDRTDFNLRMSEIFDVLKKQEKVYTHIYRKNGTGLKELTLSKKPYISYKCWADIDLWTLSKIRNELVKLLLQNITRKLKTGNDKPIVNNGPPINTNIANVAENVVVKNSLKKVYGNVKLVNQPAYIKFYAAS